MNVHHLELFYYVARHGGISDAVRNMPYGIQQPAISAQMIQLEEFLGVTLFQRRPFQLTLAGDDLFQFVSPFFGKIEHMTEKLQGGTAQSIRLGASEVILRDHIPELVQRVKKKFPQLKMALREGYHHQLENWIDHHEIDLAFTLLKDKVPPPGSKAQALIDLPLVLLVEKSSKIRSAEDLWSRDRIDEPLIALPANELICRTFQQELLRRGIDWFPSIEMSSFNLIEAYVVRGFGIGLSFALPRRPTPSPVRELPLPGFPTMTVGALWQGKASPVMLAFVDAAREHARALGK